MKTLTRLCLLCLLGLGSAACQQIEDALLGLDSTFPAYEEVGDSRPDGPGGGGD